jgi:MoxR-like ATPase
MIMAHCGCGAKYSCKNEQAGKKLRCRKCGESFKVPDGPLTDTPIPNPGMDAVAVAPAAAGSTASAEWTDADMMKLETLKKAQGRIDIELRKAIVGQNDVVRQVMIGLFAQGHCLLMGVPGLAKTLLVRSLASTLSLNFKRVQFTPDLMPSDITGTEVIEENKSTGERNFRFLQGPIFTHMLLADEINRTPPKTQAALLEAMEEKRVTVGGVSRELERPFFVLATQNPIEQEGTYPLPEAQLDRFMFLIQVGYPKEDEERKILAMTTSGQKPQIEAVLHRDEILELQQLVRKVRIGDKPTDTVLKLVRSTRCTEKDAPDFIRKWLAWGAGPRACQNLVLGAKAVAALDGRSEVRVEDVLEMAQGVLGHRILLNFAAQAEGYTPAKIIEQLVKQVA